MKHIILIIIIFTSCNTSNRKVIAEDNKFTYTNNESRFIPYTLEDMEKIPINKGDSVYLKNNTKIPIEQFIDAGHKKGTLKFVNDYQMDINKLTFGKPFIDRSAKYKRGYTTEEIDASIYYEAVGVYVNNMGWLNVRSTPWKTYASAQYHSRPSVIQPPIPPISIDSFFVANFKFTPAMLEAGLHGRVGVGIEIYPKDSSLNVFQVMDTTLGIDKEIKRILYSMNKWTPSYDTITDNFIRAEMIYSFPIQHPDSAKLKPYEYYYWKYSK